jgi:hypothetical protein
MNCSYVKSREVTRGTKIWTTGKVKEVQFGPTIISGSCCDYQVLRVMRSCAVHGKIDEQEIQLVYLNYKVPLCRPTNRRFFKAPAPI